MTRADSPTRRWRGFLISALGHVVLLIMALQNLPTGESRAITRPALAKVTLNRIVLFAPPRRAPDSEQGRKGTSVHQPPIVAGSSDPPAKMPVLEIPSPDPADFMRALRREDGYLALSRYPQGGRVSKLMRVSTGQMSELPNPEDLGRFFAVELVDLNKWTAIPSEWRACTGCAVYAAFPIQIANRIAAKAAQMTGCEHGAARASVRFSGAIPDRFELVNAEGPCLSMEDESDEFHKR